MIMRDVSSKDFFRRYPQLIWTLLNIHHHMKNLKYDYPLVICGDTGNGKSMFALHLIDLWYNLILDEKLTLSHIKHIQNTRKGWITNFKDIRPLDINCNDEGIEGMMSKDSMTRFGRDIQKLYNVFRKKLFLTIILIPDFFDLPPYFRKRIRGCIWVNRRGSYKYYTGRGIKYLNGYNDGRSIKRMEVAYPFFTGVFPDYTGILREGYNDMAENSPDEILDNMVAELEYSKPSSEIYRDKVKQLILDKKTQIEIIKELHISPNVICKIRKDLVVHNEI